MEEEMKDSTSVLLLPNTRIALQELENELKCCACGPGVPFLANGVKGGFVAGLESFNQQQSSLSALMIAKAWNTSVCSQQISSSLCSLGMCEHLVCSMCISVKVSRCCPVCQVPFNVKDIKTQLPLGNITNIVRHLKEILFNPQSDFFSSCEESQNTSEKSQKENHDINVPLINGSKVPKSNFEYETFDTGVSKEIENEPSKIDSKMPPSVVTRASKRKSMSNSPSHDNPSKVLISKIVSHSKNASIDPVQTCRNSDTPPKSMLKNSKSTPKSCSKQGKSPRLSSPSIGSVGSPVLRTSSSPRTKKNAKGETPLHVAVIKGDLEKVKTLLSEGVDVNIKDHAGWTPLHEACNLGYDNIAELLLNNGALINTPGSEYDTPLHDAVMNGRVKCVALLVSRGASLTIRNVHGFVALDYAVTKTMKEAFNTPVMTCPLTNNLQDLSIVDGGPLCILSTALNREQRVELHKMTAVLHAKTVDEFHPEVTHVVSGVNKEGMCPRTLKYLKGILAGKWIVTLDWLRTCEEYGERVSEEPFEVSGSNTNPHSLAPYKGRINRLNQLPRLFDGCQFYFHGTFNYPTPEKEDIIELVKCGGGHVLVREPKLHSLDLASLTVPFHAPNSGSGELRSCGLFIIHDNKSDYPQIRHKHLCSAPAAWILESIALFKLCKLPSK